MQAIIGARIRVVLGALALITCLAACGDEGDDWVGESGLPADVGSLWDVWAFAADDVWAVGGGGLALNFDGTDWQTVATPTNATLTDLFALAANDMWAVADTEVLHWDGNAWTVIYDTSTDGLDGLTSVWASSADDIYVVGDDAIVMHYDGVDWRRTLIGSNFNHSVWGSGPNDVWVLGLFDLYNYDGADWTEVDNDESGGEGQVWGFGPDDIWVMTDDDHAVHWDGVAWTRYEGDDRFIGSMMAVWGASPDDLWAVGAAGSVSRFTGSEWQEVKHQSIGAPELRYLLGIHGTSATDIWAVGHIIREQEVRGIIYHYAP